MSINLTLGAIVVLLAGLVLNFKSSKERQENGEWSSGLQWSYLLCMVGVFGILSEFMSFTAVLLVFVVFTGIVWAIHKGRLKKARPAKTMHILPTIWAAFFPSSWLSLCCAVLLPSRSKFRPAPCVRAWSKAILSW